MALGTVPGTPQPSCGHQCCCHRHAIAKCPAAAVSSKPKPGARLSGFILCPSLSLLSSEGLSRAEESRVLGGGGRTSPVGHNMSSSPREQACGRPPLSSPACGLRVAWSRWRWDWGQGGQGVYQRPAHEPYGSPGLSSLPPSASSTNTISPTRSLFLMVLNPPPPLTSPPLAKIQRAGSSLLQRGPEVQGRQAAPR